MRSLDIFERVIAKAEASLLSAHSLDGKYIAFTEDEFRAFGVETAKLVGLSWQDYCPAHMVDAEQSAISEVIFTGFPKVFPQVYRLWPGCAAALEGRASLVELKNGTSVVLREGLVATSLSRSEEEKVRDSDAQALLAAEQIAAALNGLLRAHDTSLPEHVKTKIEQARSEAERIRNRRIRRVLS